MGNQVKELESGCNFGYLEAMDIWKFGRSPSKCEILIVHCIYQDKD